MSELATLTKTTRISRTGHFPSRAVDNEGIVVATERGQAILLNGIGYQVWNWLSEAKSLQELITLSCQANLIDQSQADQDLRRFITRLHELQLVTW